MGVLDFTGGARSDTTNNESQTNIEATNTGSGNTAVLAPGSSGKVDFTGTPEPILDASGLSQAAASSTAVSGTIPAVWYIIAGALLLGAVALWALNKSEKKG